MLLGRFLCWSSLLCWWCCSFGSLTFRLTHDAALLWGFCGLSKLNF